jgi:hypothetical protein
MVPCSLAAGPPLKKPRVDAEILGLQLGPSPSPPPPPPALEKAAPTCIVGSERLPQSRVDSGVAPEPNGRKRGAASLVEGTELTKDGGSSLNPLRQSRPTGQPCGNDSLQVIPMRPLRVASDARLRQSAPTHHSTGQVASGAYPRSHREGMSHRIRLSSRRPHRHSRPRPFGASPTRSIGRLLMSATCGLAPTSFQCFWSTRAQPTWWRCVGAPLCALPHASPRRNGRHLPRGRRQFRPSVAAAVARLTVAG